MRTDMTKLIVAVGNHANASSKYQNTVLEGVVNYVQIIIAFAGVLAPTPIKEHFRLNIFLSSDIP